jgi:UDP-N-acetylglucosamine acyltransferase
MSIHPSAVISADARLHESVTVGPHAVVDGPVEIDADCVIGPGAVVLGRTSLGAGVRLHAHAVVGDTPQDRRYKSENSRCEIGAGTIIREGATIHRATGDGNVTRVGERCYLMTNCHIGHNCTVGNDVMLVSGALLGGHVTIGDQAIISGNTGVHQFVRVGRLAMVACVAPVTQDVAPFMMTDHEGRIVGINVVGLRRAGFSPDERAQIKAAYRLLYRTTLTRREVIDKLRGETQSVALTTLIDFLEATTDRGIVRGRDRVAVIACGEIAEAG